MSTPDADRFTRPDIVRVVLAVLIGVALCGACSASGARPRLDAGQTPPPASVPASVPSRVAGYRAVTPVLDSAVPVRIQIPSIGVDTNLVPLGLNPDGSMQVPTKWGEAGWYTHGPRPGEDGPAVIAGHVDSVSGPAVFFRLHDVHAGDRVFVTRADGSVVRFVITRLHQYPKVSFPTAAVFGPTAGPELRLVTCTGVFDEALHSYLDNLVAFASPAT